MPKFSAYMRGAQGPMGNSGQAALWDGILDSPNDLPDIITDDRNLAYYVQDFDGLHLYTHEIGQNNPNWTDWGSFKAGFSDEQYTSVSTLQHNESATVSVIPIEESLDSQKSFLFKFGIPTGKPAGFSNIQNVTVTSLSSNAAPYANIITVTTSPDTAKQFNFNFGLPIATAAGFSENQYATIQSLSSNAQPTVSITSSGPNTAKEFTFNFGVPHGEAAGFGEPEISVSTLPPYQQATATIDSEGSATSKIFKFHFNIPEGKKGIAGDALGIYESMTFTSTSEYWNGNQLKIPRDDNQKIPICILNNQDLTLAATFKITENYVIHDADEKFDGQIFFATPIERSNIEIGTVSSTSYEGEAKVIINPESTSTNYILDFIVPEGPRGYTALTAEIGDVTTVVGEPSVSISGTTHLKFNFELAKGIKGDKGDKGDYPTITIDSLVIAPDEEPRVIATTTEDGYKLTFIFPTFVVEDLGRLGSLDYINLQQDTTGILPVSSGGTGQTTLVNSANSYLNALTVENTSAVMTDYLVAQHSNGLTSVTTYHRKKLSNILTDINITTGLGYTPVDKAGDTMNGNLTISKSWESDFVGKRSDFSITSVSTSDRWITAFIGKDQDDKTTGYFGVYQQANTGASVARLMARNWSGDTNIDNYVALFAPSTTTEERSVIISHSKAWRKALQIGDGTGAFPITVAQGGTGYTSLSTNAILIGNGTSAIKNIRSTAGVLYATGADVLPKFGILPIAYGGTSTSIATSNTIFAGPSSGANAAPSFRKLVADDIPSISFTKVTGTLEVAKGGTGQASLTANRVLVGNGTNAVKLIQSKVGAFYATAADGEPMFGVLPTGQGGTGTTNGTAPLATKLANARTIQTKLNSTSAVNFDGSANITPGVTGTLGIANGGTGTTTRLGALKALTNENVGTSATHFLTITNSWGKGGYSTTTDVKTVLGLGSAAYSATTAFIGTGGGQTISGNLTISGILNLTRTQDADGNSDLGPALVIGGTRTAVHIEIDNNEILAKSNGTTPSQLNLNTNGGIVAIGSGGLSVSGTATIGNKLTVNSGGLTVSNGGLSVTGTLTANSGLSVTSGATINGTLTANNELSVSDTATIGNKLTVNSGGLSVTGGATIGGGLSVSSGGLSVTNAATIGGVLTASTSIKVGGGDAITKISYTTSDIEVGSNLATGNLVFVYEA